ncbi:hypothetical protein M378DRAFT_165393, partial [Amanita muscaria Koide BX008]
RGLSYIFPLSQSPQSLSVLAVTPIRVRMLLRKPSALIHVFPSSELHVIYHILRPTRDHLALRKSPRNPAPRAQL